MRPLRKSTTVWREALVIVQTIRRVRVVAWVHRTLDAVAHVRLLVTVPSLGVSA